MVDDNFFSLDRPLHSLPDSYQVRAANFNCFAELVTRLGGDYVAILGAHGLAPQVIEDADNFIECQVLVDVLEHCAVEFNDPLFGLHLAELQGAEVYGSVFALCRTAATFREALQCLIEFLPIMHASESVLELAEGDTVAELRWTERIYFAENVQANLQGLLLNLKVLQAVGGSSFRAAYVNLPFYLLSDNVFKEHPEQIAQIEHIIGCPVRANPGRSCIAFAADRLALPVVGASQPLFQLLYSYMYRLKDKPQQTVTEKVHQYVAHTLGNGEVTIDGCAQQLGLSSRTLQVRLQESGKNFSDILEFHRLERAKYILNNGNLSIAEIADSLGYAERTGFGRAFKRWTGMSPQQFRRRTPT